jgi:O-antigen ligase
MWTAVFNSYRESPWIGHGYFVSSQTGELYVWGESTNWTAHNMWLQALVSTGLIGTLLLAWGLGWPWLQTATGACRGRIPARLALFAAAIACWYLGWGLSNASILGPLQPESVLFFVILGIMVGRLTQAKLVTTTENA